MKGAWIRAGLFLALVALVALWAYQRFGKVEEGPTEAVRFEVWALDQSDSDPEGGGRLFIWDGAAISESARRAEPEIVDLAQAARRADCPVGKRPHMALTNHSEPPSHVVIANVGSGDIFFMDADSREMVGCVNAVGAGGIGTASTHAAAAAPDGSLALAADMAGNALHKIQTDYAQNAYRLVETLDLSGHAAGLGVAEVKPVCLEFTADSQSAYVTVAEGGLLVINVGSADGSIPMRVDKVYDKTIVAGIGCGAFRLPDGGMLVNSESGAEGGDDFLYIFGSGDVPDPVQISLPGEDAHGVGLCSDSEGRLFALTVMRVSNDISITDLQAREVVGSPSMARPFSQDPKPDIADTYGQKMFVALRGPRPLTAITGLKNPGRTPGVAVLTLAEDCRSFAWEEKDLAPMKDLSRTAALEDGTEVTVADPHGLVVVPR